MNIFVFSFKLVDNIDVVKNFIYQYLDFNIENKDIVNKYIDILFSDTYLQVYTENIDHNISFSPILILAIITVESDFNQFAIGDNGKAVGFFQLHEIAMIDVGRYNQELKNIYLKNFKSDFTKIIYYPIRQLQFSLEYLNYYNKYGGCELMIDLWNYTEVYKTKLLSIYQDYYEILKECVN